MVSTLVVTSVSSAVVKASVTVSTTALIVMVVVSLSEPVLGAPTPSRVTMVKITTPLKSATGTKTGRVAPSRLELMLANVPVNVIELLPEPTIATPVVTVAVMVPLSGGTLSVTVIFSPAPTLPSATLKPVSDREISSVPV